jgi:hypothetical protein
VPCSEQASVFPVFAKKNEGFSFADEHAGAASSVQTFFKSQFSGSGSWLSYFVPRDVVSCCSVSSPIEIAPAEATVRLATRVRKQRPTARERHRYP